MLAYTLLAVHLTFAQLMLTEVPRDSRKDKQSVIALEQEWLHAKNAATLDRILAPDFVHVLPADHFLTKQEHIDWFIKHPQPESRHTKFDKLEVRLYGDVAIVNGSVVATVDGGKEIGRSMFTDVFVLSRRAMAGSKRPGKYSAGSALKHAIHSASFASAIS
jgi:ketosteroid isomerase-like protein